jgi:hypothetical protein
LRLSCAGPLHWDHVCKRACHGVAERRVPLDWLGILLKGACMKRTCWAQSPPHRHEGGRIVIDRHGSSSCCSRTGAKIRPRHRECVSLTERVTSPVELNGQADAGLLTAEGSELASFASCPGRGRGSDCAERPSRLFQHSRDRRGAAPRIRSGLWYRPGGFDGPALTPGARTEKRQ